MKTRAVCVCVFSAAKAPTMSATRASHLGTSTTQHWSRPTPTNFLMGSCFASPLPQVILTPLVKVLMKDGLASRIQTMSWCARGSKPAPTRGMSRMLVQCAAPLLVQMVKFAKIALISYWVLLTHRSTTFAAMDTRPAIVPPSTMLRAYRVEEKRPATNSLWIWPKTCIATRSPWSL